jgi:hypothetical protein
MPELNNPYLERSPGDLITAEDWNSMQLKVRQDIGETTRKAVEQLTRVQAAGTADKLEGKSLDQVIDEVLRRALQEIRSDSGYRQLFKVLRLGEENLVTHDLHLCPLVDVYQLDYFQVVCCEDKDTYPTWTLFYLQHDSEDRVRYAKDTTRGSLSVQPDRGTEFKMPFAELLSRYHVKYNNETSLSEVADDFWSAFFAGSNHHFLDDKYCHSPWFDKCCRDEKTVGEAIHNGDWKNLFIQMRPRKTINYPAASLAVENGGIPTESPLPPKEDTDRKSFERVQQAPTQVQVTHHDFDKLTLTLLTRPVYPLGVARDEPSGDLADQIADYAAELNVMVLLKV